MSGSVNIEIDTRALQSSLRAYGDKMRGVRMDSLGAMLATAVDDLLQKQGVGGSQGVWAPLSPNTILRRPNRAGGKLLQASGLLGSMQVTSNEGSRSVEVASPAPYSGFHVTGTRTMPRRDFLALDFGKVLSDIGDVVVQRVGSV